MNELQEEEEEEAVRYSGEILGGGGVNWCVFACVVQGGG